MSYIAFHTAEQTGYTSGAERAYLDLLVADTAEAHRRSAFGADYERAPSLLRKAVNWPSHVLAGNFDQRADLHALSNPELRAVLPTGSTEEPLHSINLNTVVVSGSPLIHLAARISGQCEVHAFVEGTDRAWFGDLVDIAVEVGVFRAAASRYPQRGGSPNGWHDIANLARSSDAGPMVMSYSVCDSFPSFGVAAWPDTPPDEDDDPDGWDTANEAWDALSDAERWDRAVAGLRRKAEEAWLLRISPHNLADASFGNGTPLTWWSLAAAWQQ